jgi:polyhydroxybutyrate depolymerase
LKTVSIIVDGIKRKCLLHIPANVIKEDAPVILVFHGHSANMHYAAMQFKCERYWPEAIVLYLQGINTPGGIVDQKGIFTGWQMNIGENEDRDIRFFDSMIDYLKLNYKIDTKKIYLLGHSNGGLFVYELWAARPEIIAAIVAISAMLPSKINSSLLTPKPIFHIAGRNDSIVKYELQLETIKSIVKVNKCESALTTNNVGIQKYRSFIDVPLMVYIHNGGHSVPKEVIPYIIDFYKEYSNN